jgi:hypothetical protein
MGADWQPSVELENALHAHLIDGRVVHQHVLFVEPVQRRIAGAAADDPLPTPLEAALDRMPRTSATAQIVPGTTGLALSRTHGDAFEPPSADELARVGEALRPLARARLHFMVELTIGLVVMGTPQAALLPASAVLDPAHDAHAAARLLLAAAARDLVRQWTEVELSFAPQEDPALRDEACSLAAAFADSVLAELARRLADGEDNDAAATAEHTSRVAALQGRRPDFDRWLTGPPELALTRELVCCWYPCWRRSRFIFGGSPFDGLEALPLAGDTSAVGGTARAAR